MVVACGGACIMLVIGGECEWCLVCVFGVWWCVLACVGVWWCVLVCDFKSRLSRELISKHSCKETIIQ